MGASAKPNRACKPSAPKAATATASEAAGCVVPKVLARAFTKRPRKHLRHRTRKGRLPLRLSLFPKARRGHGLDAANSTATHASTPPRPMRCETVARTAKPRHIE